MGGWASRTPVYAALFGFFLFASVGLPGLSGFAGEFLVLLGAFFVNPMIAGAATLVMILAAVYLLWMYQRVFTGPISPFLKGLGPHLTDVTPTEIITLAPLLVMIVAFGIMPTLLTASFGPSVSQFLLAAFSGVAP
jgi:NADH-quinone oxidoreductase subunit M